MKIKQYVILGLSFILIIGGAMIITNEAIPPLEEGKFLSNNFSCENLLVCVTYPIEFTKKNQEGETIPRIVGTMKFSSVGAFSVNNPINYDISLDVTGNERVDKVYFFISKINDDLSLMKERTPNELIERAKIDQRLIELTSNDNHFERKGFWVYPFVESFMLVGMVLNEEVRTAELLAETEPLVTLEIQKIKEQAVANHEARVTNKMILGLTWMGIGLAFILLASDFMVRVALKD